MPMLTPTALLAASNSLLSFHLRLSPILAASGLTEVAGKAAGIIMLISGMLAAVGIIAAGVMMFQGDSSKAKFALIGAVIAGMAFIIVKTIWGAAGAEAVDVQSFDN